MDLPGLLRRHEGITLVELIITIALLGIIIMPVFSFFMIQQSNTNSQTIRVRAEREARTAINSIIDDLRKYEASNSTYDEDGNLVKIAGNNVLNIGSIVYKVVEGVLKRNDEVICNNIESFTVSETPQGYDTNVINIALKVVVKRKSGTGVVIDLQNSYRRKLANVK